MVDIDAGQPKHRDDEPPHDPPPRAWLLIFDYDENGVRLVERERIEMLAPPDDSALTLDARAGHWVALRDANGKTLYRQIIAQPFRIAAEVHSPEGVSQRVPVRQLEGRFQVVVPDLPEATDVVFFGLGTPAEQQQRAFGTRRGARAAEALAPPEAPSAAEPMLTAPLEPR